MGLHQTKSLCTAKGAINKMKRQLPDSEKIFADNMLSDKGLNIQHT